MRGYTIVQMIAIASLLVSCLTGKIDKDINKIPVEIYWTNDGGLDIERMIINAQTEVEKWLPDAKYGSLIYFTDCNDLTIADDEFVLIFKEIHDSNWRLNPRVYFGTTTINISEQIMNVNVRDETNYYPSLVINSVPSNAYFREVKTIIYNRLEELRINECRIDLAQLEGEWRVICIRNLKQICKFRIDAETLKIIESNN